MVLRRAAIALLAVVVVVALVLVVGVTTVVRRPFPERDGEVTVAGLGAAVEVRRDAQGVPQLYADDADDLMRAQGYVHAQDRFFEMDLHRHVASGRLSELVGDNETALSSDKVVRTLGWRRVAEREIPLLAPATRRYLQSYADGVNAYLSERSPSQVAIEYTALDVGQPALRIAPWTPVDSVVWLKAMAWSLKGSYDDEVTRARLSATLPVGRVNQLYPAYPYRTNAPILSTSAAGTTTAGTTGAAAAVPGRAAAARPAGPAADPASVTSEVAGTPSGARALAAAQRLLDAVPALPGGGEGTGSNSWVVAGSRTTTGKPLLANDPHLDPAVPGVWYQMGLHCRTVGPQCPFDVAGFTFAGFPGILIGHNARIAWGFTNLAPDVTDLYLERVVGDDVERDGGYEPLTTRTETIRVRGGDDVPLTVRSTRHGPIVSGVLPEAAAAGRDGPLDGEDLVSYDVALAWTALTPGRTADAVFALDAAQSWTEFRDAAALFEVPAQNLVYADVDGTIGYQAPGAVPVRVGFDGRWPVAGWLSRYDWQGRVPFEQMPSTTNPPEGLIVTANQAVSPASEPYLTSDWDYGYRAQRIRDLLVAAAGERKLSPADMTHVQLDTRSSMAATLVPLLLSTRLGDDDTFTDEAVQLLRGWDFTQPPDSAAAAYYNAVWRALLRLGFDDELGSDLAADGGDRWFAVVTQLLARPGDPWWDNRATPGLVESRDEILRQAMVAARVELTKSLGKDPSRWQWGRLHRLTLEHPVLGGDDVPAPLRALVNRGPFDLGGSSSVVAAFGYDAAEGFAVDHVPSMRMVVDLSDLDRSRWVTMTGASGHPGDAHYGDQTQDWAAGRTYAWPFSEAAVREATDDVLRLEPEEG